jgi:hypothetical protein
MSQHICHILIQGGPVLAGICVSNRHLFPHSVVCVRTYQCAHVCKSIQRDKSNSRPLYCVMTLYHCLVYACAATAKQEKCNEMRKLLCYPVMAEREQCRSSNKNGRTRAVDGIDPKDPKQVCYVNKLGMPFWHGDSQLCVAALAQRKDTTF